MSLTCSLPVTLGSHSCLFRAAPQRKRSLSGLFPLRWLLLSCPPPLTRKYITNKLGRFPHCLSPACEPVRPRPLTLTVPSTGQVSRTYVYCGSPLMSSYNAMCSFTFTE